MGSLQCDKVPHQIIVDVDFQLLRVTMATE